jgi:hypothetical protein
MSTPSARATITNRFVNFNTKLHLPGACPDYT